MKSTAIVCALAASLGFASLAQADNNDRRGRGNEQRFEQRGPNDRDGRQADRHDPRDNRHGHYQGGQGPRGQNFGNARNDRYPHGASGPQFVRGRHIPAEYRGRQYHVNDWRSHHLGAPQRGQQWVQVGTDYALIALATGLILNIALSH